MALWLVLGMGGGGFEGRCVGERGRGRGRGDGGWGFGCG